MATSSAAAKSTPCIMAACAGFVWLGRLKASKSLRMIEPPNMPNYIFEFLQYLDMDIDKKLGISDAFRGMSEPGDSGVKTQTLILQTSGRLQSKVTQMIEFVRQLYQHWIYIIQRYYPDVVMQETADVNGERMYEEFDVSRIRDVNYTVELSKLSVLPFDNYAEFEEGQMLMQLGLISPQHFIDMAPSLRDKQRAKEWVNEQIDQTKIDGHLTEDEAVILLNSVHEDEKEAVYDKHPDVPPQVLHMEAELMAFNAHQQQQEEAAKSQQGNGQPSAQQPVAPPTQ